MRRLVAVVDLDKHQQLIVGRELPASRGRSVKRRDQAFVVAGGGQLLRARGCQNNPAHRQRDPLVAQIGNVEIADQGSDAAAVAVSGGNTQLVFSRRQIETVQDSDAASSSSSGL